MRSHSVAGKVDEEMDRRGVVGEVEKGMNRHCLQTGIVAEGELRAHARSTVL